jgi:dimethylglycine dehydrogenase
MEFSAMAKFEVSGAGAGQWLDFVMANKMPSLGRMILSPMLSPQGRLAGDFSIARIDGERFIVLGADYMQLAFMRHFDRYLSDHDVLLKNLSSEYAGLHICGPNAQALISRLAEQDMDSEQFPFMSARSMTIGGIDNVLVFRVSFTGETGYEMYLPMHQQLTLFDLLRREGENLGLGLVGTRALMQTRLEKSFPAWALELSPDYTAVEANMDRFVNPHKQNFIGRESFLNYAPAREKFVTLTVDAGDCAIWGDEAIYLDADPVGYVSSGGFGPVTEKHIALGYVSCDAYRASGQYSVEILGKLYPAELQVAPLYDPAGIVMRA